MPSPRRPVWLKSFSWKRFAQVRSSCSSGKSEGLDPVRNASRTLFALASLRGHQGAADYADVWTLTRSHDVRAIDLVTALAATSEHRGVSLRPLSTVLGDYGAARADAFAAYQRRLGPDAAQLPDLFAAVVDDVVAFADPALDGDLDADETWRADSSTWST